MLIETVVAASIIYLLSKKFKKPAPPDLSFLPKKFIIFDLETTGLDPLKHEILEIGAIRVNRDSDIHETFQQLLKPRKKIPARATAINGITQEMVDKEGKELSEVINDFIEFIADHRLVAFNADFDMGFIKTAALKHGHEINNDYSCALKMSKRAWPGLKSYKLESLAKRGNLSTKGNHRALKDCELTALIYMTAAATLKSIT